MSITRLPSCVALALLCCAGASVQAQELNWAQKMFEKQSHDFGVVARGADADYRLKIVNKYVQPVHIANVRTSCGCTAATPSKDLLNSTEEAYIEIKMDTRRFTREKNSNVIITFDAPLYQEVTIPIHAYIRTDVVLTPGSANFGSVAQGAPQEQRIEIAYAGRQDWKITGIENKNEDLTAEFTEKVREAGRVHYELVVKLRPSARTGTLRDQIMLITDDQNSPKVPVLIEAKVETEFTITPEIVSLGVLSPGQKKTVNVVVRGRKPFAIDKIESESGSEAFQVRLPDKQNVVHVLPLIVTAPADPGALAEDFTITVGGNAQPLHFKVSGKVAGPETATAIP